jgi:hypothetical protein
VCFFLEVWRSRTFHHPTNIPQSFSPFTLPYTYRLPSRWDLHYFGIFTQRTMVLTDVSRRPVDPILKGQAVLGRFDPWKWEPIVCPEMSSSNYQPALRKNPKDSRSHSFRGGGLKLCVVNDRTFFWHFAKLNVHKGNDTSISNLYMQRKTKTSVTESEIGTRGGGEERETERSE